MDSAESNRGAMRFAQVGSQLASVLSDLFGGLLLDTVWEKLLAKAQCTLSLWPAPQLSEHSFFIFIFPEHSLLLVSVKKASKSRPLLSNRNTICATNRSHLSNFKFSSSCLSDSKKK